MKSWEAHVQVKVQGLSPTGCVPVKVCPHYWLWGEVLALPNQSHVVLHFCPHSVSAQCTAWDLYSCSSSHCSLLHCLLSGMYTKAASSGTVALKGLITVTLVRSLAGGTESTRAARRSLLNVAWMLNVSGMLPVYNESNKGYIRFLGNAMPQ